MSQQTLARPYAKAAFELALSQKTLPQWSAMLGLAAMISNDPTMKGLFKNPQLSKEQLVALFFDLGKDEFNDEMKNLLKTLSQFKRLPLLPQIWALFEDMKSRAMRTITVELISALPINEAYQQRLSEALKRRTNCEVSLACITDKSIIGGAIVRSGDLVIDGSVRGRLATLSDAVGIS